MVSGKVDTTSWHEEGEVRGEVHRVEHEMSRPVIEAVLESLGKLPAVIAREVFGRDRRSGDVAEHALEGVPFMGLAPPAGMKGESPTPSDARSEYQGIACDRAQDQGLVPGVGADGNAVVDGGDDDWPELVDGLKVEGVGLVVAQRQPLLFHGVTDTGGDTMEQALDATLRRCPDSAKTGVLLFERVGPGVPPKLIIFNGFLVGAGAQHCQGQIRQRDRFATTMTIPDSKR